MSEPIFPTLAGLSWQMVKTPVWSTIIQRSANGRELRSALYANPLWEFSLSFEFLRAGAEQEYQQLAGLFNISKGQYGTFLFSDPTDNTVVDQPFGSGNGSQIVFPLSRTIGTFSEPIAAVDGTIVIKAGGTQITSFTIANGLVTFASPPTGLLTWSGKFFYRCRFLEDKVEFENFMYKLWSSKKIKFQSVR
jgi:uncharacterized protein (TIGR02217 family)